MTQETALSILKTGVNVFLTGEPGSGKTHTINAYVAYLRRCGIYVAMTASTGIAATHIGGFTIHSWSGMGIKRDLTPYDIDKLTTNERIVRRMRKTPVLIIDEVSMLDARLLTSLDKVCRAVRQRTESFGGMQVVFVGDFFQLPPVARGGEQSQFAFYSLAWSGARPIVCYLSEQHRQEDTNFLSILSALRSGDITEVHTEYLNERCGVVSDEDVITKLFAHNVNVDQINEEKLGTLDSAVRIFEMEGAGAPGLVEGLKRGCLSPEKLALKIGARVMFTKNNFNEGFVNGTLGDVIDFDTESGYPIVETHRGARITAIPMDWQIEENGKVRASITQIPLRLAWAMTIHKSQGMSLDSAYMDLSSVFEYGQGYVALSRVRTLSGLFLAGYNARALAVHPDIAKKDGVFRTESDMAESTFENMQKDELRGMQKNFVQAHGGKWVSESEMRMSAYVPTPQARIKRMSTYEATRECVEAGKSLDEIARERGLTRGTVFSHIEKLRASKVLSIEQVAHLVPNDVEMKKAIAEIHSAFGEVGTEYLKSAHEHFDGRFDYDTIRFARLLYEV